MVIVFAVFRIEWLNLIRSPLKVAVLAGFLLCGVFSVHSGAFFIEKWKGSIAEAEKKTEEYQKDALSFYDKGQKGPEGSPWVDMNEGLWAEWYSGTFHNKVPTPLAQLSLGLSDVRANSARVSRFSSPYDKRNLPELVNPEKLLTGNFDFSFVITFLFPLLIILLTIDIQGFEQENGLLRLVYLQSPNPMLWLIIRLKFAGFLAMGALSLLWLYGGWASGAFTDTEGKTAFFIAWLLSIAYGLFWFALATAVISLRRSSGFNALALSLLWLLFCVLIPASVHLWALQQTGTSYSLEIIEGMRSEKQEVYDRSLEEVLALTLKKYPEFKESPFVKSDSLRENDFTARRHLYDLAVRMMLDTLETEVEEEPKLYLEHTQTSFLFNPSYAFQHGLNYLAKTEADNFARFNAEIREIVHKKIKLILDYELYGRDVDREGFLKFAALRPAPPSDNASLPQSAWALAGLALLAALGSFFFLVFRSQK